MAIVSRRPPASPGAWKAVIRSETAGAGSGAGSGWDQRQHSRIFLAVADGRTGMAGGVGKATNFGIVSVSWFGDHEVVRSEEHTSELQSLMRNSYAVFCLKKKQRMTYI